MLLIYQFLKFLSHALPGLWVVLFSLITPLCLWISANESSTATFPQTAGNLVGRLKHPLSTERGLSLVKFRWGFKLEKWKKSDRIFVLFCIAHIYYQWPWNKNTWLLTGKSLTDLRKICLHVKIPPIISKFSFFYLCPNHVRWLLSFSDRPS